MLLDQGRVGEAVDQFERARRIQSALPATGIEQALALGQGLSWLSSALALDLRLREATAVRREEIALYDGWLAREPRNAVALERMALARRFLAELMRERGELAAARVEADGSAAIAEAQLALEQDNVDWQLAAAKAWLLQAMLALEAGDAGAARQGLAARAAALDAWMSERPDAWAWQVDVAASLAMVESDLAHRDGDRATALAIARDGLVAIDAAAQDAAQDRKAARWRVPLLGRVAWLRAEDGDDGAAGDAWARLLAHASGGPQGADVLAWEARAHAALGRGDAAAQRRDRLRAAGYRATGIHQDGDAYRVAGHREGRSG
jgi:hypothetical protein